MHCNLRPPDKREKKRAVEGGGKKGRGWKEPLDSYFYHCISHVDSTLTDHDTM